METPDDPDNNPPTDQNPSDDNNNPSDEGGCVIYYTTTDDKIAIFVMNGKAVTNNTYENGIGTIKLSTPITVYGDYSAEFYYQYNLKSVILPDCVTKLTSTAFQHAESLESVTLPSSLTSIASYAFYNCHSMTSINIPHNVTTIGELTFGQCSNLTNISIGRSVKTIGAGAFSGCYNKNLIIYCHPTVPPELEYQYIENGETYYRPPFDDYAEKLTIYVPEKSVGAYRSAPIWIEFSDNIVGYNFDD